MLVARSVMLSAEYRLERLLERTRQMLAHNPAPILLLLPDLTLLYANPGHEALTGRLSSEISGMKMFDVFPANPGSAGENAQAAVIASIARVMASQSADELLEQKTRYYHIIW